MQTAGSVFNGSWVTTTTSGPMGISALGTCTGGLIGQTSTTSSSGPFIGVWSVPVPVDTLDFTTGL